MKIGMIGYGEMGAYHRRELLRFGGITPVAAYDIAEAAARKIAEDGLYSAPSVQSLLEADLDAVLIATPNDAHADYVIAAAKAGKHIFCETPAAMNVAQYREMRRAAEGAGVTLFVNRAHLFRKDFLTAEKLLKEKRLGKIYRIESREFASGNAFEGWRACRARGGGMLLNKGVPLIEQALKLGNYDSFDCTRFFVGPGEAEDGFELRLHGKIEYQITVDSHVFVRRPRWMIYGSAGTACLDEAGNGEIRCTKNAADSAPKGEEVISVSLKGEAGDEFAAYRLFLQSIQSASTQPAFDFKERVLSMVSDMCAHAHNVFGGEIA